MIPPPVPQEGMEGRDRFGPVSFSVQLLPELRLVQNIETHGAPTEAACQPGIPFSPCRRLPVCPFRISHHIITISTRQLGTSMAMA